MARKSQQLTPLMLRLPEKLHRRLVQCARSNQRSLNNELVSRLEWTVEREDPLPPQFERLQARILEAMNRRNELESELARTLLRVDPTELKSALERWMRIENEEEKS